MTLVLNHLQSQTYQLSNNMFMYISDIQYRFRRYGDGFRNGKKMEVNFFIAFLLLCSVITNLCYAETIINETNRTYKNFALHSCNNK